MTDEGRIILAYEMLAAAGTPERQYEIITELVVDRIATEHWGFFLFLRTDSVFKQLAGEGLNKPDFQIRCDVKPLWNRVRAGTPFKFVDKAGSRRFDVELDDLASEVWIPFVHDEKVVGLMTLGRKTNGKPFTAEDAEYLKRISVPIAFHLHLIHKETKLEKEKSEIGDSKKVLTILSDICNAMTSMNNQSELLRYILRQSIATVNAEKGSLLLYDKAEDALQVRVVEGNLDPELLDKLNSGEIPTRSFKPGEGIAGQVYQSGRPVVMNDTGNEAGFIGQEKSYVNSIVCVPLVVHGESIGVINLTNKTDGAGFSEKDQETLGTLAGQAAIALNRALLWEMAVKDSLTGLFVRRFTLARLHEELRRARRYVTSFSVALIDVDHFKRVNDDYGHPAGDRVLKMIGQTIREGVRDIDVVGRFGGEEFLIVMPETDKKGGFTAIERLRGAIANVELGELPSVTVSGGIATFPEDADGVDGLISKADTALLEAKRAGRDRAFVFGPHMASVADGEYDEKDSFTRVMFQEDLEVLKKFWK
jgi:diguanylate cyclase (GGDEF)-like protein